MIRQFCLILWLSLNACEPKSTLPSINGANLVGPPDPFPAAYFKPLISTASNYVAIIPFAFSKPENPQVAYNQSWQWWGEKQEGIITMIDYAKQYKLKVMLKPHVWVMHQGWPGDFKMTSEEAWQQWERQYEKYILEYAHLADSMDVSMFCIGTEFRYAVQERPEFWLYLINKVRGIYEGHLTYAANWDNYQKVPFWSALDFIGINAYWALSNKKSPEVEDLKKAWVPIKKEIERLAAKQKKPVLFTEFGYQSIDYSNSGHWKLDHDSLSVNEQAQRHAYEAFFSTFWSAPWCAGGFFWKWFPDYEKAGGHTDKNFTPQRKAAEAVIKKNYSN